MSAKKTNAARHLDDLGIVYTLHRAEVDESDLSAVTMAHRLGVPPDQVFKTLVARGDRHGVLMACIPGSAELDMKKLAAASGNKSVTMVALKEVQPLTGYIRGGCSPLGMKKRLRTVLDSSARAQAAIVVSAGKIGYQVELSPQDLAGLAEADFAPVTRDAAL